MTLAMDTPPQPLARVLFGGDLFLGGEYARLVASTDRDWASAFVQVRPLFGSAHVRIANLEAPLGAEGPPAAKRCLLHSPAEAVEALQYLHFDVLTLGNNHVADHGGHGIAATRKLLTEHGIACCGAGTDLEEASQPAIVTAGGVRIAVFSFTAIPNDSFKVYAGPSRAGYVELSLERARQDIARALQTVEHVCISLHWGHQYHRHPTPWQVQVAHALIDLGATVVHGHHPHVLQGIERYRHGVILYSLGNLFMPDFQRTDGAMYRYPRESRRTAVVLCELRSEGVGDVQLVPLRMTRDYRLRPTGPLRSRWERRRMDRLSKPIGSPAYPGEYARLASRTQRTMARREALAALAALGEKARSLGFLGAAGRISRRSLKGVLRLVLGAAGRRGPSRPDG